jgi:hypothetical protein
VFSVDCWASAADVESRKIVRRSFIGCLPSDFP